MNKKKVSISLFSPVNLKNMSMKVLSKNLKVKAVAAAIVGTFMAGSLSATAVPGLLVAASVQAQSDSAKRPQAQSPLNKRITVEFSNKKATDAIDEIVKLAEIPLSYQRQLLKDAKTVSGKYKDAPAGDILKAILAPYKLQINKTSTGHYVIVAEDTNSDAQTGANGTIAGTVTDSKTSSPISGVGVVVVGTSLRVNTNVNGFYTIRDVPTGHVIIEVRALGYEPQRITVPVVGGSDAVTQSVALVPSANVLSEVVTTATGDQRRMEVPNAIARINVEEIMKTAPIRSVTDLLADRVPGVSVSRASGSLDAPTRIRIRGIASSAVSNDPVLIVDGVRVSAGMSDSSILNRAAGIPFGASGDRTVASRIDNIDPASIETIEVLRGPSASALYGTDAANGVIVIKTKRGRAGQARWNVNANHDWTSVPVGYPNLYRGWGTSPVTGLPMSDCTIPVQIFMGCTFDSVSTTNPLNNPFTSNVGSGKSSQISTTVSGGSNDLQYSLTASFRDRVGVERVSPADVVRLRKVGQSLTETQRTPSAGNDASLSTNISIQPKSSLDIGLTLNASQQRSRSNRVALAHTNTSEADTITYLPFQYVIDNAGSKGNLLVGGLTINWRPISWLNANIVGGADRSGRVDRGANDPSRCTLEVTCARTDLEASRTYSDNGMNQYNAGLNLGATRQLGWGTTGQTSVGVRYRRRDVNNVLTRGRELPFGENGLDAARLITAEVREASEAMAGWYLEQNISHNDRIFFTAAMAQDASSAFGKNVQAPWYPRLGISWVISNEPFFPQNQYLNRLRLRTAYGHSGVQPNHLDGPPSYVTNTAIVDGEVVRTIEFRSGGNSLLKPERSAEVEFGFEADLLNDRASLVLTLYNKKSTNALISRELPPSAPGSILSRMENLGNLSNRGIEASLTGRIIDSDGWLWSATVSGSSNRNRVESIGKDVLPFGNNEARVVVGYPVFGRWQLPVIAAKDANGNGVIDYEEVIFGDTAVYVGSTQPRYEMMYSSSLLMPWGVQVTANFSYRGAFSQLRENYDGGRGWVDPTSSPEEQAYAQITRIVGDWQTVSVLRFSSIMLTYALPAQTAKMFRSNSMMVTFSGDNLGMWSKYRGSDPTVNSRPIGDQLRDNGRAIPQTRNWSLGLRMGF